ncbi:MAG: hypothetical protein Q7S83_02360 [bacterium]|nr:hypothetical protein [bacterium]
MDDQNKFPFELPKGSEAPAKNPPAPPPAGGSSRPEVKIATGKVGSPAGGPDFISPETFEASPIPAGVKSNSSLVKNIILAIVAVVFVGGVGALSYFVVFPLLFPPKGSVTNTPPVVASPITHKSYLVKPPAAEVELKLNDHKYLTIATALQSESFNQLAEGQMKEVKISENGAQVPFPTFLSSVSPVASALADGGYFEKDFTAMLYYDASGVWPVYVAKLKASANAADLVSIMKSIEGVLDLGSFYLAPPGSFATFKDGQINGRATRYSVGTQAGAAFNYGLLGDYFVLATSYNGLKAAVPLLGL